MSKSIEDTQVDPQTTTEAMYFLTTYVSRYLTFGSVAIYCMFSKYMWISYGLVRYTFPHWSWLVAWLYHGHCLWNNPDVRALRRVLFFALFDILPWERALFGLFHTGLPLTVYLVVVTLCYNALPLLWPSILLDLGWKWLKGMTWLTTIACLLLVMWFSSGPSRRQSIENILNASGQVIAHSLTSFLTAWEDFCLGRGRFLIFWWKIWERRADRIFQSQFSQGTVEELLDGKDGRKIFNYSPLTREREIRLLEVSMGPARNIEAKVIHIPLDQAEGTYDAISYTWGNPAKTHGIVIDGAWLPTTVSVYNIVFQQTPLLGRARIWIDYVCINQVDIEEKGKQVCLMRDIYSSATQVVACIGGIYNDDADITEYYLRSLYANRKRRLPRRYRILQQQTNVLLGIRNPKWASMSTLLNHPYWTRVWIIQEIANAKKLRIMYGDRELSWDALRFLVLSFFDDETDPFLDVPELIHQDGQVAVLSLNMMLITMKMREDLQSGEGNTIKDVLPISSHFRATDKRDHVFGLEGIMTEEVDTELLPNYSMEIEELFRKVAYHLLRQDDPLWLFHHSGISHNRNYPHLPTWVPDWTTESWISSVDRLLSSSSSGPSLRLQPFWKAINSSNQWMLPLEVAAVGTIVQIAEIPTNEGTRSLMEGKLNASILSSDPARWSTLRAMARHRIAHPYITGESSDEALWRTLVGYVNDESNRDIPFSLFAAFDKMMTFYPTRSEQLDKELVQYSGLRRRWKALKGVASMVAEFSAVSIVATTHILSPMGRRCSGRCVAVTDQGHLTLVPRETSVDDTIFLVQGADSPVVLRDDRYWPSSPILARTRRYRLVGDCYVHGLTSEDGFKNEKQWQEISLF